MLLCGFLEDEIFILLQRCNNVLKNYAANVRHARASCELGKTKLSGEATQCTHRSAVEH